MSKMLLEGIKVLDLGSWVAGPAAATMLGDLGAEVIKVEPPGAGDPYRYINYIPDAPQAPKDNYAWQLTSRNKRSLAIDIKSDPGKKLIRQLIASVDVMVTNFPPKVLEKLQLRYEDVSSLNEKLVYAHLSGYGEKGEEANTPAFDRSAFWARSGMMDAMRNNGGAPNNSLLAMGDHPAALSTFGAIMTGLYQRERSGKGSKVHSSLMATGAWCHALPLQAQLSGAEQIRERPREKSSNALALPYGCADDRWFLLWLFDPENGCINLLNAIGKTALLDDPRFATLEARTENAPALTLELDSIFASQTWAHWQAIFDSKGIDYVQASDLDQVVSDKQYHDNEVFVELHNADADATQTVNSPVFVEGFSRRPAGPAPNIGEHSDEILMELGLDAEAIKQLREDNIVVG